MVQKSFGGIDTDFKLKKVSDYASFFTTALKDKGFKLSYVDVFAGTGEIPIGEALPLLEETEDIDDVIMGSARRALEIDNPFHKYIFADLKRKNTNELKELETQFPHRKNQIVVEHGEANDIVRRFCRSMRSNDRALMFLDPFGNQVDWATLETIAATKKIDLFYLFPSGLGVARQVSKEGKINTDAVSSLDRIFGNDNWQTECVKYEKVPDLFEPDRVIAQKIVTADSITRYMIKRMSEIFDGGVSESWLPLGKNKTHKFSLLFACSNPAPKAKSLAHKVAKEIMKRR